MLIGKIQFKTWTKICLFACSLMKKCFLARQSRDNHRKGDSRRYKSYDSTLSRDMRVLAVRPLKKSLICLNCGTITTLQYFPRTYITLHYDVKKKERKNDIYEKI